MRSDRTSLIIRLIEKSHVPSALATVTATALAGLVLWVPQVSATEVSYVRPAPAVSTHVSREIYPSIAQVTWLGKLVHCESHGDTKAVNPKDVDGTPSFGILQFKPSTFAAFSRAYRIGSPSDYMDPVAQRAIVLRMMRDPSVDWHVQFPACVQLYGLPPGVVA